MNPQHIQNLMNSNPDYRKYMEQSGQVINVSSEQQVIKQVQQIGGQVINQQQNQSIGMQQQIQGKAGFQNGIQGLVQNFQGGNVQISTNTQVERLNESHHSRTSSNQISVGSHVKVEEHHSAKQISGGVVTRKEEYHSSQQTSGGSSNSTAMSLLDIETTADIWCSKHSQEKEYILMENLGEYTKFQPLCSACIFDLEKNFRRRPDTYYYMSVINDNKANLLSIKNKQINIESFSQGTQCRGIFMESIYSLVEELHSVCQEFSQNFIEVIDASSSGTLNYGAAQIKKIQIFIDNIELKPDGSPNDSDIGNKKDLLRKYIKLACFLLHFQGFSELSTSIQSTSFTGVTSVFKSHVSRIIEIRKRLVVQITEWLKFLMGPFYEFVFGLEKLTVDSSFRSTHISFIEFITENINIHNFNISQHKDYLMLLERITIIERENRELRIQLENKSTPNVVVDNTLVIELQNKIKYLETIITNHKTEITNITNTEITTIINKHRTEITNISKSFELKISELNFQISTFIGQTEGFKKQIELITRERDEWRIKFEQGNVNVNVKNESYVQQINEFNIKIQNIYGELSSWKTKYEQIQKEYEVVIIKFGKLEEERNFFRSEAENLKIQITNINITINTYVNELNNLKREREGLVAKFESIKIECNTRIENHINQYNIIVQEKEEKIRKWENEAGEWKFKYDQTVVKISHYEEKINQLSITINKHIENITIVNGQMGDWEKKYRLVIVERDSYIKELESLRVEIHKHTKIVENNSSSTTIIIKEREDKISFLEQEIAEWKFKFEQSNVKLKEYELRIQELTVVINKNSQNTTIITNDGGDWKKQYEIVKVERDNYYREIERIRNEILSNTRIVENSSEKITIIVKEKDDFINRLKQEVGEWRIKFESSQKQIEMFELKIKEMNTVISRHVETTTIINNTAGDWESKYNILVKERDSYISQIEKLRTEIISHTTVISNHSEKHTLIIREKEESLNRLKEEVAGWRFKCEQSQRHIEMLDLKIVEMNTIINKHVETTTIINNNSNGDWESKYNILVMEKNSYLEEIDRLRTEVLSHTKISQTHIEKHTYIIKERDDRIKILMEEATEWRVKYESLHKRIEDYERRISQMQIEINSYIEKISIINSDVVSGEDWESKYWEEKTKNEYFQQEIERLTVELMSSSKTVEKHVEKHVIVIRERDERIRGLEGDMIGLRMELNSKISIITRLEMTIKSFEEKINELNVLVEKYQKEVTVVKSEKTTEIHKHILLVNTCKEEFFKLSESYESLLIDIKQQISINEALRKLVIELMNKIEEHNYTIGSLDSQIKQQIEILTRQTLSKKYIDALPSLEVVSKSEKDMLVLRNKVGRMETEKLHKSLVFTSSSQNVLEIIEKREVVTNNNSTLIQTGGSSSTQTNVTNTVSNVVNNFSGGLARQVSIGNLVSADVANVVSGSGVAMNTSNTITSNMTNVTSNVSSNTTTNMFSNVSSNSTTNVTNISGGVTNTNISAGGMIADFNRDGFNSGLNRAISGVSGGTSKLEVSEKHEFVQIQTGGQTIQNAQSAQSSQTGAFNYLADLENLKNIQTNLNNLQRNYNNTTTTTNVQVMEKEERVEKRVVNEVHNNGHSQQQFFEALSSQSMKDSVHLNPSDY